MHPGPPAHVVAETFGKYAVPCKPGLLTRLFHFRNAPSRPQNTAILPVALVSDRKGIFVSMFQLAQTPGGLYRQLHAAGYGPNQLRAVQKSFAFSNRVFSGVHHACGKPLICHLTGTASAVAAMDSRVEMVCAGLAHALFVEGMFRDAKTGTAQAMLEAEFGPSVYRLIAAFGQFRWDDQTIAGYAAQSASANESFRSMLILRLAATIDDAANMGLMLGPLPGPARGRIENCARIADSLGQQDAARLLDTLIGERERDTAWTAALNPAAGAPFRVVPNVMAYLRLRLRGDVDVA